MIIVLTGFMGCGKSSVAEALSPLMGCFHFDLDDTILMEEGFDSVSEIFASLGERAFRDMEYKYLERIISDYEGFDADMVIALGGGTVLDPRCAALLRDCGARIIYLRASVDTLLSRLGGSTASESATGSAAADISGPDFSDRPLLCGYGPDGPCAPDGPDGLRARVSEMLALRDPVYTSVATEIVATDGLDVASVASSMSKFSSNTPLTTGC